jgi:hypothetical protein
MRALRPRLGPVVGRCGNTAAVSTVWARGVSIGIKIVEDLNISESIDVALQPQNADRDWRRKWNEIEHDLREIDREFDPPLSGPAILTANQRLHLLYVQMYSLRDALIHDQGAPVTETVVLLAMRG